MARIAPTPSESGNGEPGSTGSTWVSLEPVRQPRTTTPLSGSAAGRAGSWAAGAATTPRVIASATAVDTNHRLCVSTIVIAARMMICHVPVVRELAWLELREPFDQAMSWLIAGG